MYFKIFLDTLRGCIIGSVYDPYLFKLAIHMRFDISKVIFIGIIAFLIASMLNFLTGFGLSYLSSRLKFKVKDKSFAEFIFKYSPAIVLIIPFLGFLGSIVMLFIGYAFGIANSCSGKIKKIILMTFALIFAILIYIILIYNRVWI